MELILKKVRIFKPGEILTDKSLVFLCSWLKITPWQQNYFLHG